MTQTYITREISMCILFQYFNTKAVFCGCNPKSWEIVLLHYCDTAIQRLDLIDGLKHIQTEEDLLWFCIELLNL